jgi:hypothetical protein
MTLCALCSEPEVRDGLCEQHQSFQRGSASASNVIALSRPYWERHDLQFKTEIMARAHLENLLEPWFILEPEVELRYEDANRLRIDYLARPRPDSNFPYPWFGIECKRGFAGMGDYNDALKQAIDYTHSVVVDGRFDDLVNERVLRVFVFPGMPSNENPKRPSSMAALWAGGVNRLAGKFHVGMIYERSDGPLFEMSAVTQWSATYGPASEKVQRHIHRLGSGRPRSDPIDLDKLDLDPEVPTFASIHKQEPK